MNRLTYYFFTGITLISFTHEASCAWKALTALYTYSTSFITGAQTPQQRIEVLPVVMPQPVTTLQFLATGLDKDQERKAFHIVDQLYVLPPVLTTLMLSYLQRPSQFNFETATQLPPLPALKEQADKLFKTVDQAMHLPIDVTRLVLGYLYRTKQDAWLPQNKSFFSFPTSSCFLYRSHPTCISDPSSLYLGDSDKHIHNVGTRAVLRDYASVSKDERFVAYLLDNGQFTVQKIHREAHEPYVSDWLTVSPGEKETCNGTSLRFINEHILAILDNSKNVHLWDIRSKTKVKSINFAAIKELIRPDEEQRTLIVDEEHVMCVYEHCMNRRSDEEPYTQGIIMNRDGTITCILRGPYGYGQFAKTHSWQVLDNQQIAIHKNHVATIIQLTPDYREVIGQFTIKSAGLEKLMSRHATPLTTFHACVVYNNGADVDYQGNQYKKYTMQSLGYDIQS